MDNIDKVDNNSKIYQLTVLDYFINVNVMLPTGENHSTIIPPHETVLEAKKIISMKTGIWIHFINLFVMGDEDKLLDKERLFQRNVINNSNIFMLISPTVEININSIQSKTLALTICRSDKNIISWIKLSNQLFLWEQIPHPTMITEYNITKEQYEWILPKLENNDMSNTNGNIFTLIVT
jgi:hypothetical protein